MSMQETMRSRTEAMLCQLQDTVSTALERMDGTRFREDSWQREGGGSGLSRVLQDGHVFEKAGVNTSTVMGSLSRDAARAARVDPVALTGDQTPFFASSISLVIHPHNPYAPTAHAHYRYFEVGDGSTPHSWWFSGSVDLTPCYLFVEDVSHFHRVHKVACDLYDPGLYPRFKQACDEYFYLPHREEHRGVGGLFLGNLNDREQETLFALISSCAQAFLPAYMPLLERRFQQPFGEEQKRWQRLRRGRYVEFNLLCDRGTAFGLKTGARTESILMSLPLVAGWEYAHQPEPGSPESQLLDVLQHPREWV